MILHKENTLRAEPFYKSISDISIYDDEVDVQLEYGSNELKMLEKYSYFIQNLISFEQDIKNEVNVKILMTKFLRYLKGIIPVKEFALLFYDEFKKVLIPIDEEEEARVVKTMNHFNQEGIFRELFIDKTTITVPDLESYNSDGPKLFYLILPVYDEKKNYGILSLLTSLDQNSITELEKKSINIYLNLVWENLKK